MNIRLLNCFNRGTPNEFNLKVTMLSFGGEYEKTYHL